ncbi:MAG TPA: FtsX-like permease family protein, partial [Opitutus sp.]|nr:FtsX-like permease family protein [Opitutus sp.]
AWVRVRGKAEENVAMVRDALRSLAVDEPPPRVAPLRDVAFRTLEQLTRLAVFIGGLALALAAAGIHASVAFSTNQRTQEIGVRVALGATRASVLRLILRGGLKVVAAGCALGVVAALVGLRLLFSLLSGSSGIDPVAIAGVMAFFTLIATAACLRPALKATKVDPMVALRAE